MIQIILNKKATKTIHEIDVGSIFGEVTSAGAKYLVFSNVAGNVVCMNENIRHFFTLKAEKNIKNYITNEINAGADIFEFTDKKEAFTWLLNL